MCIFETELDDDVDGEEGLGEDELVIHADEEDVIDDSPSDCFPDTCYKKFPVLAGDDDSPFWQGWANLRLKTFQLIENKYFETAVITMILLSSLALVNRISAPSCKKALHYIFLNLFLTNRLSKMCICHKDQFYKTSYTIWTEYSP